eukprot:671761-Pyramimonas_sp.AAC.1
MAKYLSNLSKSDQKLSHCPFWSGRPTSSTPRSNSSSSSMPKSSTRYWAPAVNRQPFLPRGDS